MSFYILDIPYWVFLIGYSLLGVPFWALPASLLGPSCPSWAEYILYAHPQPGSHRGAVRRGRVNYNGESLTYWVREGKPNTRQSLKILDIVSVTNLV